MMKQTLIAVVERGEETLNTELDAEKRRRIYDDLQEQGEKSYGGRKKKRDTIFTQK